MSSESWTFALWDADIHQMPDQLRRIKSAKAARTTPDSVNAEEMTGVFIGSGSKPYITTLDSCACVDFARRKLPCKHIYRLAIELGLLNETAGVVS